jgi:dolichol-phosphate mannosyltransferase
MTDRAVWVVLPAFEEEACLGGLIDDLVRHVTPIASVLHVVVVDDGSEDRTREVALSRGDRCDLEVLSHPRNEGLGRALRTGLERVAVEAAPEDVVVTMDADGSHLPEQIPAMVDAIDAGADLVIGSRYRAGALVRGVPAHRALLSGGMQVLARLVAPVPGVTEYTSAFRAMRAGLLQRAVLRFGDRFVTERGFAGTTQILLRLGRLAPRVVEIPLDLRYDQKLSPSRLRVPSTIARNLWVLLRDGGLAPRGDS